MTVAPCRVGTLGVAEPVEVDAAGRVTFTGPPEHLDWWIGADDRWREPGREFTVRQHLNGGAPVVVTALRVPGGDAVQTVYATGSSVVVEIHNDSPAPFVAALVLGVDESGAGKSAAATPQGVEVTLDDTRLRFDGDVVARFTHAPSAVARADDLDTLRQQVVDGVPPGTSPTGRASVRAVLLPVAHRARVRVTLPLEPGAEPAAPEAVDDSAAVARGWATQRDRGLRVEWPDPSWSPVVDAARSELLLSGTVPRPSPDVVAALEDWGYDDEAVAGWAQLGFRGRGRARRRRWAQADPEKLGATVERLRHEASPVATWPDGPAEFLLALRAVLGREHRDGAVELLPVLPAAFLGGDLTVSGLPTRHGPVSYALRWHGARPALLWEAPEGTRLRMPGIDPEWASAEPTGDALLNAPDVSEASVTFPGTSSISPSAPPGDASVETERDDRSRSDDNG